MGGLVLSGGTLYGTTYNTIFSVQTSGFGFNFSQLALTCLGLNNILTWPTNQSGFTLQSTLNLASNAAWTTVFPTPVVINGQNTVTNPISGAQQFFRLSQ